MKKSLILCVFLASNTFGLAFAAQECTPKELEALKTLQAQLVLVCNAVDFQKLPAELQNQGIENQCKTLRSREITMESCAALKAELAKNAATIPNPLIPESSKSAEKNSAEGSKNLTQ